MSGIIFKVATRLDNSPQQATGLDAGTSRVDALHSLCRIVMEYYLLNMHLKATICHIIVAKSQHIMQHTLMIKYA